MNGKEEQNNCFGGPALTTHFILLCVCTMKWNRTIDHLTWYRIGSNIFSPMLLYFYYCYLQKRKNVIVRFWAVGFFSPCCLFQIILSNHLFVFYFVFSYHSVLMLENVCMHAVSVMLRERWRRLYKSSYFERELE